MCFNPDKCEVLHVTRRTRNVIQSSCSVNNTTLKLVSSAKYLGVIIDSKLNFNEHVKKAKRQIPLAHLSIETQVVVQWKSKHLHTRPSYDPSWSMLRQFGPLTLTVTLTVLKQFSAELPDLQWKTGVDQLTSNRHQQLEQHRPSSGEVSHLCYRT